MAEENPRMQVLKPCLAPAGDLSKAGNCTGLEKVPAWNKLVAGNSPSLSEAEVKQEGRRGTERKERRMKKKKNRSRRKRNRKGTKRETEEKKESKGKRRRGTEDRQREEGSKK